MLKEMRPHTVEYVLALIAFTSIRTVAGRHLPNDNVVQIPSRPRHFEQEFGRIVDLGDPMFHDAHPAQRPGQ
jgi:hypothetical protein